MTKRRAYAVSVAAAACCYILYLSDEINLKNVSIHVECYMINWSCSLYLCACMRACAHILYSNCMYVYKFYFVFTNLLLLWRCKEWEYKLETIAFHSQFLPSVLPLPLRMYYILYLFFRVCMMQLLFTEFGRQWKVKWCSFSNHLTIYLSIYFYLMFVFILRLFECNTMLCYVMYEYMLAQR